jgi:hypothetical protein
VPYEINKQDCEQSDGDDGSHVLSYTDKKGKKHDNCHTSKKKAQAQIGYIGELDETDDMVFGGGGDPEAEGEGEEDGMDEALLREWIRAKLLLAEVAATASQIFKDPARVAAYLDQVEKEAPFELVAGGTVTIPVKGNNALVAALEAGDKNAFNRAWKAGIQTSAGVMNTSGALKKTEALGGERAGKRLDKEDKQIGEIQAAIDAAGGMIDINLGRKVAKGVTSIETVTGTPKADAVLKAGEEVVGSISLKYASAPGQMQQWGGLTKLYEGDVPSVVEFIKDVKHIEETNPTGRIDVTYFREIDQPEIAQKICYGGGSWPENDCDMIIASQTPIQIDEGGNFVADHLFFNPDVPAGEWYPTLFARYSSGRGGGAGLGNVRLSLSPKGARRGEPLPERPATTEVEAPPDAEVEAVVEPVQEAMLRAVIREALLYTRQGEPLYIEKELYDQIKADQDAQNLEDEREAGELAEEEWMQIAVFDEEDEARASHTPDWTQDQAAQAKELHADGTLIPSIRHARTDRSGEGLGGLKDKFKDAAFLDQVQNVVGLTDQERADLEVTKKGTFDPRVKEWAQSVMGSESGAENLRKNRSAVKTLSRSLAGNGVGEDLIDKIVNELEIVLKAGMPDNYTRMTISSLADFEDSDAGEINSAQLPQEGTGDMPGSDPWEGLMDVARGSRSEQLGRGEVAAAFHFENVNPPDFGSGDIDLTDKSGMRIHVKDLSTSGKRDGWYESIPGKKGSLMDALEASVGGPHPAIWDAFEKTFSAKKNLGKKNIYEWAQDTSGTLSKVTPKPTGIEIAEFLKLLATEIIAKTQNPAVMKDGEFMLMFSGTTWRIVPNTKCYFKSTDKTAVNVTLLSNKSPLFAVSGQAAADILKDLGGLSHLTSPPTTPRLGRNPTAESLMRNLIREKLILEVLSASDKADVKRIIKKELSSAAAKKAIRKEIDGSSTKTMIDKAFKKQFDKELRAALGMSFFGTPGKINKFVVDAIHDEVEKILGDAATREMVVQICKDVIIKLYRELSFTYKPVIQRLKV